MGEITESSIHQTAPTRPLPFREDCWSEEATSTVVDAWGRRYMELNRGNLRQKDWQEVADAVNALHGHSKKTRRTDVQCKNRIDTLKKKYKVEKAKIAESGGTLTSSWPFFDRLDALIGNSVKHQFPKVTQVVVTPSLSILSIPSTPMAVPLPYRRPVSSVATPVILPQKRLSPSVDDSYFRRNYSAVAAAAAADAEEGEEESEEGMGLSEETMEEEGIQRLAKAIDRFREIYERVEGMKQRQLVELEKQRMQFAKDLEVQRMQLLMDTQVQLEKIKQAKRPGTDDIFN